jgi:hypothetical protein
MLHVNGLILQCYTLTVLYSHFEPKHVIPTKSLIRSRQRTPPPWGCSRSLGHAYPSYTINPTWSDQRDWCLPLMIVSFFVIFIPDWLLCCCGHLHHIHKTSNNLLKRNRKTLFAIKHYVVDFKWNPINFLNVFICWLDLLQTCWKYWFIYNQ